MKTTLLAIAVLMALALLPGQAGAAGFKPRVELATVIEANPPLVEATFKQVGAEPDPIATLTVPDWERLMETVDALSFELTRDDRPAEREYGELLEQAVEGLLPQAALVARLPDSSLPVGDEIAELLSERPTDIADDIAEHLRRKAGEVTCSKYSNPGCR